MNVAILGAECTGKTALAQALQAQLLPDYPDAVWVPEYLREWCDTHGRTPQAPEQHAIGAEQMRRVQAHAGTSVLLCDTTPLMTAIYSELVWGDTSLYPPALAAQRQFGITLLCAPDLPWVADGLQRDGEAMRSAVDQRLRAVLRAEGIAYAGIYGAGDARCDNALQAIRYALGAPRSQAARSQWAWPCEKCSDPACEHRLFRDLLAK